MLPNRARVEPWVPREPSAQRNREYRPHRGTARCADRVYSRVSLLGARRNTTRTLLAATTLVLVAGCASHPSAPGAVERGSTARWQQLPGSPLTPRAGAVTAWTGTEAVFLGGDPSAPCPPNASCVAGARDTRDGAAFNPDTRTWRATATAPEPIATYSTHAVLAGRIYLWGQRHLLSYDPATDTWYASASVAADARTSALAVLGRRVVAVRSERGPTSASPDVEYDPANDSWSPLPPDPLGAASDRAATATPRGLVLTGHALVADPGAAGPSVVRTAVLDATTMTWRRLPDSDELGGGAGFTWTGHRLVDATLGGDDGGQVGKYGRVVPRGGTLDPATGTWGRLPDAPESDGGWTVFALGSALSATDGWVYDDTSRSWTKLDRPPAAPERPGDAVWAGRRLIVVGGVTGTATRVGGAWLVSL